MGSWANYQEQVGSRVADAQAGTNNITTHPLLMNAGLTLASGVSASLQVSLLAFHIESIPINTNTNTNINPNQQEY
jgi:hypothetical protein